MTSDKRKGGRKKFTKLFLHWELGATLFETQFVFYDYTLYPYTVMCKRASI